MWPCVWQPNPKTADVTVTKIAGYVRVRILMNLWFFRIFCIHTFHATATLLNIWICMQWNFAGKVGIMLHAAGCWRWQNSVVQPITLNRGRQVVHAMNWWGWVVGEDWTLHPWHHNCCGCHCGPGATQLLWPSIWNYPQHSPMMTQC